MLSRPRFPVTTVPRSNVQWRGLVDPALHYTRPSTAAYSVAAGAESASAAGSATAVTAPAAAPAFFFFLFFFFFSAPSPAGLAAPSCPFAATGSAFFPGRVHPGAAVRTSTPVSVMRSVSSN